MPNTPNLVVLAVDITAAFVAKHHARSGDAPAMLSAVHATLTELSASSAPVPAAAAQPDHTPAVSVRKSLASREHIVSMIDGKPYRGLKRHLSAQGLTPDEYRQRYGLKPDYPMVAPAYSEVRSAMSKARGFGRRAVTAVVEAAVEAVEEVVAPKPKPAARGVAAAKAAAKKHLAG